MKIEFINCWKYIDRKSWAINFIRIGRLDSGQYFFILLNVGISIGKRNDFGF